MALNLLCSHVTAKVGHRTKVSIKEDVKMLYLNGKNYIDILDRKCIQRSTGVS